LLVLDMMPHDRHDLKQSMGHLWQGFASATLAEWARDAGFEDLRYNVLPPDPEAKGPLLFAASAKRASVSRRNTSRKKADAAPLMKSA
jgi:hypothetical protein